MDKHFYEMIKDWTVRDFRTPAIKAEVIVDMLISDFIEELIQYHYLCSEEKDCDVKLLTKEFPIEIPKEDKHDKQDKRNAKVDYLVSLGNETLVLVELKTTNDSFDYNQKNRMEKASTNKAQDLLNFYKKIVDPTENENKGNSLDKKKYRYIYENMFRIALSEEDEKKLKYVKYMYIFLEDNSMDDLPKLILKNYCKGGKYYEKFLEKLEEGAQEENRSLLWEKISDILHECVKKLDKKGNVME